jgi:hypothetical protein
MPELPAAMVYKLEVHFFNLIKKNPGWPVLLSAGDSWFSLDTRGNTIDQLPNAGRFALLRLEQTGDELLQITGGAQMAKLRKLVGVYPVQALLYSAGGNDIIGPDFERYLKKFESGMQPADILVQDRLSSRFDQIEGAYRHLLDLLDDFRGLTGKKRRDVTLFVHGYDYVIPDGRKVKYLFIPVAGPWMQPGFKIRQVPEGLRRDLVRLIIDGFNQRLAKLAAERPLDFLHIDLRGLLMDNEFGDEIHPTRRGYVKVAERFRIALEGKFPGFFPTPLKP